MKLIRKLMQVSPDKFPQSLVNVVIAVAQGGAQEHDKMLKVCMATLCELGEFQIHVIDIRMDIKLIGTITLV